MEEVAVAIACFVQTSPVTTVMRVSVHTLGTLRSFYSVVASLYQAKQAAQACLCIIIQLHLRSAYICVDTEKYKHNAWVRSWHSTCLSFSAFMSCTVVKC